MKDNILILFNKFTKGATMKPITLIAILIVSTAALLYLYVKFIDFLVKYNRRRK